MFAFFDAVANIFRVVVDYVVGFFSLLLNLVKMIFKAQVFLIEIVGTLPPFILGFFLVFIALAILFQILNKGA